MYTFLLSLSGLALFMKKARTEKVFFSYFCWSPPFDIADNGPVDLFAAEGIDCFGLPVFGKGHDQILGQESQPFHCHAAVSSEGGHFPVQGLGFF